MIQEYKFNISKVENGECLFPKEISDDSWVVYHGTSSINENSIDQNGLKWSQSSYSKDDIQRIIDIYEKMEWTGTDKGGFEILKSFTMNYDFKVSDKKPIFLAESSIRALLYATSDFVGGETSRAIRKSIHDLENYVESRSIRDDHIDYRRNEYEQSLNHLHPLSKPHAVDLAALKDDIEDISILFKINKNLSNKHKYGLVYAVKLSKKDIQYIEYNRMGIVLNEDLSANQLIRKIKVPAEYTYELYEDRKKLEVNLNPKGLYLELQKVAKL